MKLYLIQHGKALPEEKDSKRSLSPEGVTETQKIADFLKTKNIKFGEIWHSKKTRAVQTAGIISKALSIKNMLRRDDLNPDEPVEKFPDEIKNLNKDLMIAGHLPFLQRLASLLLTGSETDSPVSFKNSGLVCLEFQQEWKILWYVIPELL